MLLASKLSECSIAWYLFSKRPPPDLSALLIESLRNFGVFRRPFDFVQKLRLLVTLHWPIRQLPTQTEIGPESPTFIRHSEKTISVICLIVITNG